MASIVAQTAATAFNVTLTSADTQYMQALPATCRAFQFRCRTNYDVRYAYENGKVATPTAPYLTLPSGAVYYKEYLALTAATLCFATAQAGVVVEMEAWT